MDQDSKEKTQLSIQEISSIGAKVFALLLGLTYVFGFLTLNSYFYQYGIIGLGIANSDYLVAGLLFILYLAIYAVGGGRATVYLKQRMGTVGERLIETNGGNLQLKALFAILIVFVEWVFLHCISAAFFASIAFGPLESVWFFAVLFFAFPVIYFLDVYWGDDNPFICFGIPLIFQVIAVAFFFSFSSSLKTIFIFILFSVPSSLFVNLVFDVFERHSVSIERFIVTLIFSVVVLLGSAVPFGAFIYGDISKMFGGGKSVPMEIGVAPGILDNAALGKSTVLKGDVVYSSQTNVYINVKEETLVLPRSSVQWMKFKSQVEDEVKEALGIDADGANKEADGAKTTNNGV